MLKPDELTTDEKAYMLLNRAVWLLDDGEGGHHPLVDRLMEIMDDLNNGDIRERTQKHD
tara:strand:+ start:348 stop:524 length:177 start_codon:yes stop_codon:yes gene_type:complete